MQHCYNLQSLHYISTAIAHTSLVLRQATTQHLHSFPVFSSLLFFFLLFLFACFSLLLLSLSFTSFYVHFCLLSLPALLFPCLRCECKPRRPNRSWRTHLFAAACTRHFCVMASLSRDVAVAVAAAATTYFFLFAYTFVFTSYYSFSPPSPLNTLLSRSMKVLLPYH